MADFKSSLPEDFLRQVDQSDPNGCWVWMAARSIKGSNGYGIYRSIRAHRFVWAILNGPIPRGLFVCHHCDNPPCVRPDHLFLGTQSDNIQDAARKGRLAGQKLSVAQALDIRRRFGAVSAHELACEFGVSIPTVRGIAYGSYWKHLEIARSKPTPTILKTHCVAGHEFTPENIYRHGRVRHCRACVRLRSLARIDRLRSQGRCIICGLTSDGHQRCGVCREKRLVNDQMRRRSGL